MRARARARVRARVQEQERGSRLYLGEGDKYLGPGPELLVLDGHRPVLGVALELHPVAQAVTPGHLG